MSGAFDPEQIAQFRAELPVIGRRLRMHALVSGPGGRCDLSMDRVAMYVLGEVLDPSRGVPPPPPSPSEPVAVAPPLGRAHRFLLATLGFVTGAVLMAVFLAGVLSLSSLAFEFWFRP